LVVVVAQLWRLVVMMGKVVVMVAMGTPISAPKPHQQEWF
jgi:hypothetical protein